MSNSPLNKSASESVCWNFKLLAHHELGGFGGMGEGMAIQVAKDGRRIIWLAHESAPKNFTAVDVSDPRKPKVVVQTDLPESFMRSNSLELSGDIMAVAYQTQKAGQKPAGFELFDVSVPEKPRSIAFVDALRADLARRPPAVVLRRRIRPHGGRRARLQADQSARRPVLPHLRRAQSVEARRGRALVAARHARGRQRAAAGAPSGAAARQRLPRPQHQRLSAAAGPLLSRLYRRRHVRDGHFRQGEPEADLPVGQLAALYRLHPHGAADVRAQAPRSSPTNSTDRRRRRLAEADLDPRCARRGQSGADLDLPDAAGRRLQEPRRPLRRPQHPREHAVALLPGIPRTS